jgi:hypothetical protein
LRSGPETAGFVEEQQSRPAHLLVVQGERVTPELGDARLRSRKEQRAAGAGHDSRPSNKEKAELQDEARRTLLRLRPLALNARPARSNRSYEDDPCTLAAHFEQCGTSSYPVRRHLR